MDASNSPQTLQQAIIHFSDFENCREFMVRMRWPDGKAICPRCGSDDVDWLPNGFSHPRRLDLPTGHHLRPIRETDVDVLLDEHPVGRELLSCLADRGVTITCRDGRIVERTGLMAILGALDEVDNGRIARGSRVLVALTSGAGTSDGRAVPHLRLNELSMLDACADQRWFGNGRG